MPTFILTKHAVERFNERVQPTLSFAACHALLKSIAPTAVRIPTRPSARHHEWRTQSPHCVLVCLSAGQDRYTVTTVLGPGDTFRPQMREAVPSTNLSDPTPPPRAKRKLYRRGRAPQQGRVNIADQWLAEMAAADEERAMLGPTPAQREREVPAVVNVPAGSTVAPLSKIEKAQRGKARADMLAEYKRLSDAVASACDMIGFGNVTIDDCTAALARLTSCAADARVLFQGKVNTLAQLDGTLRRLTNRVRSLQTQHDRARATSEVP